MGRQPNPGSSRAFLLRIIMKRLMEGNGLQQRAAEHQRQFEGIAPVAIVTRGASLLSDRLRRQPFVPALTTQSQLVFCGRAFHPQTSTKRIKNLKEGETEYYYWFVSNTRILFSIYHAHSPHKRPDVISVS